MWHRRRGLLTATGLLVLVSAATAATYHVLVLRLPDPETADRDGLVRSVHAQWNVIDCACCDHSWQSAHAFQDLLEVAHLLHRLGKFRARNCSRHGEYAMWLEAGIHSP